MTPREKVRENRLRRTADRQGLVLKRSRRRDPRALDYGRYWLIDKKTSEQITHKDGFTLDAIEARLLN